MVRGGRTPGDDAKGLAGRLASQGGIAARLFGLFLLCGFVPLAFHAAQSYFWTAESFAESADHELRRNAKQIEFVLFDRLRSLDREAERLILEARSRRDPLPLLRERCASEAYGGIVDAELVTDEAGIEQLMRSLAPGEREWLARGRRVLHLRESSAERTLPCLLVRLDPARSDALVRLRVREDRIWDSDLFDAHNTVTAILDDRGRILHRHGFTPRLAADLGAMSSLRGRKLNRIHLDGEAYLATARPIFLDPLFASGWTVVSARPESAVYAGLRTFELQFAWLTASLLALILLISRAQIRRILRPLERLTTAAYALQQQKLDTRVEIESRDEFGRLGDAFDQMAGSLQSALLERERAAMDLRRARDVAERALSVEKEIVANVSHELRTPLASVRAYAELLLDVDDMTPDESQEFMRIILSESERLSLLLDDLLTIGSVAAEPMDDSELVDLEESLRMAIDVLTAQADGEGVLLRLDVRGATPAVMGLRHRLHQVWLNLIGNALKYCGGKDVVVEVRAEDGEAVVRVTDQGPGIPPELRGLVFERFRQVSENLVTDKPKGTGLGLAIAKDIVERHGGTIGVESEIGRGSSFWVRLPQFDRIAAWCAPTEEVLGPPLA